MEKEQFINLMSQVEADMFHLAFSVLHSEQECADAVQEAVVKAYAGRNTLKKQEYFKTWIMRILLNECYALLRRQKRLIPMEEQVLDAQVDFGNYVKEEYLDLYKAIDALKEKDRICVLLYYIEGYSVRQIAQIMQMPDGTVKSRLRRARIQLKNRLED